MTVRNFNPHPYWEGIQELPKRWKKVIDNYGQYFNYWGGGQNFERLKFRNFKVANIKITKDELFDSFIIELIFSFFRYYLNTQNI